MASNKRLNATITIGGAVAGTLRTAIGSTTSSLGKIGAEIRRVKAEQKMLTDSIRTFGSMGKNVDNLRARYAATVTQIDRLTAAQKRLDRVEKARVDNAKRYHELTGQIGATIATAATMTAPIVMSAKFETAMLGVAKQLDGARDSSGKLTQTYFDMVKQVQILGRELPIPTNEIAAMVAAGLRMGVAKDEVIEFTRVAAKMGTAFELPVEELSDSMGKIANMFKIPIKDIEDLADSINYLDDNAIAKGGDIIDFMQRVGGTASMVKISAKETAALGSTLLTLGEKSETASTAVNAVFSKLGAANTGSKPFREMVTELGLTTNQIEKWMQTDAIGGIYKIMDAVRKLPKIAKEGGTSQIDAVSTLFGMEHWDSFSKLLDNRAELEKQIRLSMGKDATGSMSREFKARMATTEAQWATFKNRASELAVNVGSVLLPVVNDIMSKIGAVVSKVADWAQANPALTKTIVGAAVALGTFKVGLLAVRLAMVALKSPILAGLGMFARLRAGLTMARGAFGGVGAVIRQIGFALVRTPWGAATVGLVAAGVAIYKYWDRIKAFFGGFWEGLKAGMQPVITSFSDLFKSMSWLSPVIEAVGKGVGMVYDWFVKLLSPTKATDEQLKNATGAGQTFGRVVGAAINIVLTPVKLLVNALSWISNNIGSIIGKVGSLADSGLQKVGNAIDKAKSFVGLGDAPAQTPRSVPAVPPMRGGNTSTYAPQISNSFTIHAAPGMNTDQLANDIMSKINKQNGVKQRSSMLDMGYAQ
ncbi:tape measure protein [Acinetobacter phage vB_AbaP_Alexa]|nr:tape measure protein [Acinetobacter phage vB_AbaP_Alexa]